MRFSAIEIQQILLAVAAMTLAFALASVGGITNWGYLLDASSLALIVGSSFIAVITAFLFHELAHKVVAQRYGCLAEFRAYPMGLVLGIVTGAFGFLFAAPGAVMISGPMSTKQHARISAAGPGTNLVIATAFLGLYVVLGTGGNRLANTQSFLIGSVALVNLFLGGFNLVPFPPLDGSKILFADKVLWGALVIALVVIGYAAWKLGVLSF